MEETNKNVQEDLKETTEEINEEVVQEDVAEEILENEEVAQEESTNGESEEDELAMLRKNKDEVKRLNNEVEALKERLLRISAEYDNYRKRTTKEKEGIYTEACTDVLKEMIPVLDTLERAIAVDGSVEDFKKGIDMTIKGFKGSFEKLGVEEIDATGEFDPNLHQAVMHVQDESFGTNSVVEVFQKGYKKDDKIIRHTMVKVAN